MTILVLAGVASAAVQKGDREVEFIGGWLSENGSADTDFSSWFVAGDFNYFLSDYLSFGIGGIGSNMQVDGTTRLIPVDTGGGIILNAIFKEDRDITIYGIGPNLKLHFKPTGPWVPYVGAQFKWVSATIDTTGTYSAETFPGSGVYTTPAPFSESFDASGLMWGPLGGVRVQLNDRNDLVAEAQYHMWTGDLGDVLDNGFGIFFGVSHKF